MSVTDLAIAYLGVGCVCALVVRRRQHETLLSAALCIPLWPLWLPFVLSERDASHGSSAMKPVARIEQALSQAMAAAVGTPFEALWPPTTRASLIDELRRVGERLSDLERCIAAHAQALAPSELDVCDAGAQAGEHGTLTTGRLRRQAQQQLVDLRDRNLRALAELAELVELLHAQLLVARLAGTNAENVDELIAEVRSRLEAMSCVHFGA